MCEIIQENSQVRHKIKIIVKLFYVEIQIDLFVLTKQFCLKNNIMLVGVFTNKMFRE